MSLENDAKLEKMNTEEKLKYAEKLVFGIGGVEMDLSSGMHIIKAEANSGNPHAEFLMYKIKLSRGKIGSAVEWLKKAYKHEYGLALAMMFHEFRRGYIKGISEDEVYKSLRKAVALDIPVAHYFIGIVYENGMFTYGKNKEKADIHFEKAKKLGYSKEFLLGYECEIQEERGESMTNRTDHVIETDDPSYDPHFKALVDYERLIEARNEIYHKYRIIQEIIILLDNTGQKDLLDVIVKRGILTKPQIKKYLEERIHI